MELETLVNEGRSVVADSTFNHNDVDTLIHEQERHEGDVDIADDRTDGQTITSTHMVPRATMNRQERDIALAGLLLDEQLVDERKLEKALSDWTIHGCEPLLDHLVTTGVIASSDSEALDAKVTACLGQLTSEGSPDVSAGADDYSVTVVPLNQLDLNGRAATLLGVSSPLASQHTQQFRRFTEDYTLLRKLGQGGLGIVWLARDNSLSRYVAIKEVTEAAQHNPTAISRFRREAVITGRLEHPSIVPVHQYAEDLETGRTFYAMRFLGKRTLQDAIAEYHERRESEDHDPMLLHHLLSAFVSVCQAIAYAHSKDVVHRDLKPENVALDGFGQVIVLDWGLAKLIGEADLLDDLPSDFGHSEERSDQTVAGQVMGTPMYMSPEQATGRIDEIDERTDVYGLGAILFAILTGYAPHELSHRSLSSQSKMGELLTAIVSHPTPRPSDLNPEVVPELDAICSRALAKKRYARYESASDLAEDVQRWMAGEPVSSYDAPWQKRAQRWVRNHHRLSQFIAGLTTMILVAAISMGYVAHQDRLAEQDARFDNLHAEARELEIRLGSHAAMLSNHVRFMAGLPPIQGIIDAGNGDRSTDDIDVWRERLQTIFRGLLTSNQDYLSVSYSSIGDDFRELVRVERQTSDGSLVQVLPESRLSTYERRAHVEAILDLNPGDVLLVESSSIEQEGVTSDAAHLKLLAVTPIYDEQTGDVFGIVGIEMNLERVLEYLMESTNTAAAVYVTDASGRIVMHHTREHSHEHRYGGRPIAEVVPELKEFSTGSQPLNTSTDGSWFHAAHVRLDSRRDSPIMGLILTLEESD